MKRKITTKKGKQPARKKRAPVKRKAKHKMATATETRAVTPAREPGKDKSQDTDMSEKQRADKELKERLEREGPSPLTVEPPKTATDTLRDHGFPVVEIAVAPLPGGGPSAQPGMSNGSPPPTPEAIQEGLDAQGEELEKKNKEREKQLEERKKQEKARLDEQKKTVKKTA
jgi:hypothetical protein